MLLHARAQLAEDLEAPTLQGLGIADAGEPLVPANNDSTDPVSLVPHIGPARVSFALNQQFR